MSMNGVTLLYLVASVCFIQALKGLSNPKSARAGNVFGMVAADASALYSRNVLDFLKLIISKEATLTIDTNDDIVAACLVCRDGEVLRAAA